MYSFHKRMSAENHNMWECNQCEAWNFKFLTNCYICNVPKGARVCTTCSGFFYNEPCICTSLATRPDDPENPYFTRFDLTDCEPIELGNSDEPSESVELSDPEEFEDEVGQEPPHSDLEDQQEGEGEGSP